MNFLRRWFGRRPVDIAYRQLLKAQKQMLDVEFDIELCIASRDVLQHRIARLEHFIKTEGLDRTEFSANALDMARRKYRSRTSNSDFDTPYADPFSLAVKALGNFSKVFIKPKTGN